MTPLINTKGLLEIQGKNVEFYIKNETVNNNGLFTDRIAKRFFELVQEKESIKNKEIIVDIYRPMMTLSIATVAIRLGYKMIVFYDQYAN